MDIGETELSTIRIGAVFAPIIREFAVPLFVQEAS